MKALTKLNNCVEELDMVNRCYAALSSGTKATMPERKPRIEKLIRRKRVLKEQLLNLVDEYTGTLK